MNAMFPMKLLAPMVLILGAALPASAQQPATTFERVGCYIDLTGFSDVPTGLRGRLMTLDSSVHCPGNPPPPNIIVNCDLLIGPGWPPGLRINTRNHVCLIDGTQCGFPGQEFRSDNTHLQIKPVKIDGEVFGDAQLRCMNRNGS